MIELFQPDGALTSYDPHVKTVRRRRDRTGSELRRNAFTLLELLVVLATISLLVTFLLPAARKAHAKAQQAFCRSQQRQLVIANMEYAIDHGTFVPAAEDMFGRNLMRWHGIRDAASQPFDGSRGPLSPYLGEGNQVRICPTLIRALSKNAQNGFEAACGGYGYNAVGIGSQSYIYGFNERSLSLAMPPEAIGPPTLTIMFSDTALPQPYNSPDHLIEYSFAEPYYFIDWNEPVELESHTFPSIHFRHEQAANVAWADGHISSEVLSVPFENEENKFQMGWLGEPSNAYFDLK